MSDALENLRRPLPPDDLLDVDSFIEFGGGPAFMPDNELTGWIRQTFIEGYGPLVHERHNHLKDAMIGCLWTNVMNNKGMKSVLAMTEVPQFQGGMWQKGRHEMLIRQWFGQIPDFIITFYAPWACIATDEEWCAVVEHELCHCAQKLDLLGFPAFSRVTGLPLFAIRDHDVSEFQHVVERYGCVNDEVAQFVRAALKPPTVALVDIAHSCGTCLRKVA